MEIKKAKLLMEETRKEIASIRENAAKENRKCPPFPQHVWNNIAKLMVQYSRSEIIKTLSIVESQCTRATQKAKNASSNKPAIRHQFVDISSSISPTILSRDDQSCGKKMILEIKTKNGNIISVYE